MNSIRPAPGRRLGSPLLNLSVAFLGGAVLACLLLSFFAGLAEARDGQVKVFPADYKENPVTVKLSELGSNDINNRTYRLNSGSESISGHSLLKVMRAAEDAGEEINLATILAIAIDRPSGNSIRIDGDDMRNPAAFTDGPPVFYEDNGATVFVMPGKGGATGNRVRFSSFAVQIYVSSGDDYEVDLSAFSKKVKVGQRVIFRASVTGQVTGEPLSYRWVFGDGTIRTTSQGTVSHKFQRPGAFQVTLIVSGDSGAGQDGYPIEVGDVKEPKPTSKPKPEEDRNPVPSSPEGDGGTGEDGGGFGGGSGSFGSGTGGGPSGAPLAPPASEPKAPEPDPPATPDDGLVEVEGQLVDPEATTVVTPAEAEVIESTDPASPGTEQGGFGVPGAAWSLLGVGLLMGLGMFAELRVFSRLF